MNDFLQVGGDQKWLKGLDMAPCKLQMLGELNKILAHRPWLLTKEHIEVWPQPSTSLSLSLSHILSLLHALSFSIDLSFYHGLSLSHTNAHSYGLTAPFHAYATSMTSPPLTAFFACFLPPLSHSCLSALGQTGGLNALLWKQPTCGFKQEANF